MNGQQKWQKERKALNVLTLARNCLVITFKKLETNRELIPYADDNSLLGSPYSRSNGWSSDSERPFSPDLSSGTHQSPSLSWPASDSISLKCTCNQNFDGYSLFSSFIRENSTCFWNPKSLVSSVSSLEYKGYILPSSILIIGADYDLEIVRTSWTKRVLKAPQGYQIECFGKFLSFFYCVNGVHKRGYYQLKSLDSLDASRIGSSR